jgi:hypothetical protein
LIIMNEFIVPFLPLLLVDEMEEKDILAVEDMRNRWCSYLGQEMECKLNNASRHLNCWYSVYSCCFLCSVIFSYLCHCCLFLIYKN